MSTTEIGIFANATAPDVSNRKLPPRTFLDLPRDRGRFLPVKTDEERGYVAPSRSARAACRGIVEDPEYRTKLLEAARKRKLSPPVEVMLWAYAYGRPVEKVEITQMAVTMTDTEIQARLAELLQRLGQDAPEAIEAVSTTCIPDESV